MPNQSRRAYYLTRKEVARLEARHARSRLAAPGLGVAILLSALGGVVLGAAAVVSGLALLAFGAGVALGVLVTVAVLVARTDSLSPLELVDSFVTEWAARRAEKASKIDPPSTKSSAQKKSKLS